MLAFRRRLALQSGISETRERFSSAFARDSANHARAVMALEERMAHHIAAADQTETRLGDLNAQYVQDAAS
eukprot:16445899-Heterocapsa_arctica.AAC.1